LPTLDINGRNPTVVGSVDMPLLRREEGAAGEMVVRKGRRFAGSAIASNLRMAPP
jgi:hypothetical protein